MTKLKISIIAKDKIAYQGEAISIVVPTKAGIIEIMPEHMQLVSALAPGELVLNLESGKKKFTISNGVLEVRSHNDIIILSDKIEE